MFNLSQLIHTIFSKSLFKNKFLLPGRIVYLIATIIFLFAIIDNVFDYYKQSYNFLVLLDLSSMLIVLVSTILYLKEKLSLKSSAGVFIYILILNLWITNFCYYYYQSELFVNVFLYSSIISIILVTLAGFCLGNLHVFISTVLYLVVFFIYVRITKEPYLVEKTLIFPILIIGYSIAVGLFLKILEESHKNAIFLIQDLLKKQKIMYEKETEIINQRIYGLNSSLETKNKNLVKKSLQLIQYAENNDKFIDELNRLKTKVKYSTLKKINSLIHEYEINNKTNLWNEFEVCFEKVHKDFYINLHQHFPDITPNERKLAAFSRLGMSTKQIAALTGISPQSIDVSRSRLRKKLGVGKSINLKDFFMPY